MNASKMSVLVLGLMSALICFVFVNAQAIASSNAADCVMTDQFCPCAEMQAPGSCMNHNGNNQCSLGACKPSYRCDCLGYEMCKRSPCAMYVGDSNVTPSGTGLFPCHRNPTNAVCTTFDYVMDTAVAMENIYTAVINTNEESSAMMMEAYEFVAAIEEDIMAVNEAVKNIGRYRHRMTAHEADEIEKEAETVISFVADSGELALIASREAEKVYQASRDVAEIRHQVKTAEQDEKPTEQALNEAQQRAKGSDEDCTQCASLREQIENTKKARKEAILKAADISKKARECNRNAGEHRNKVLGNRAKAAEGKQRLLSRIDEISKRVINVDI